LAGRVAGHDRGRARWRIRTRRRWGTRVIAQLFGWSWCARADNDRSRRSCTSRSGCLYAVRWSWIGRRGRRSGDELVAPDLLLIIGVRAGLPGCRPTRRQGRARRASAGGRILVLINHSSWGRVLGAALGDSPVWRQARSADCPVLGGWQSWRNAVRGGGRPPAVVRHQTRQWPNALATAKLCGCSRMERPPTDLFVQAAAVHANLVRPRST